MEFLDPLEAEKFKNQKCVQFYRTPCISYFIYYIICIAYYLYFRVSLINKVCMVTPLQIYVFLIPMKKVCVVFPLPVHISSLWCLPHCSSVPLPHLAMSWILSDVENLSSFSFQDEVADWCVFVRYLTQVKS